MGQALIVKDGVTTDEKLSRQSIASAKDKVVLSDAHMIDMEDPFHDMNQPQMVDSTSKNIPNDLSWGIREVFFKASGTAVMSITGTNTVGNASVWFATVSKSDDSVAYSDWSSLNAPVPFIGATQTKNGVQGLVPKPLAADYDMVLLSDGTWGIPESIIKRITMLQEAVNNIIDALNGSVDVINGANVAAANELTAENQDTTEQEKPTMIGPDGLSFVESDDTVEDS